MQPFLEPHQDRLEWLCTQWCGALKASATQTVQRYVAQVCSRRRGQGPTVRGADGEPGDELQIDFGRMALVPDPAAGRNRVVHALLLGLVEVANHLSPHQFIEFVGPS
jgi:hypothetical protein